MDVHALINQFTLLAVDVANRSSSGDNASEPGRHRAFRRALLRCVHPLQSLEVLVSPKYQTGQRVTSNGLAGPWPRLVSSSFPSGARTIHEFTRNRTNKTASCVYVDRSTSETAIHHDGHHQSVASRGTSARSCYDDALSALGI